MRYASPYMLASILALAVPAAATAAVSITTDGTITAPIDASGATTTTVLVTPNATIVNDTGTPIDTVTVALSGYVTGDSLAVNSSAVAGLTSSFLVGAAGNVDSSSAILTLTGTGTAADWQAVLRTLTFSTTSTTASDRSVSIVLANARYFSNNGHYYRVITSGSAITWTAAKTAADAATLFGVQGYLVTITSAQENAFLASKVKVNSWFGASDEMNVVNAAAGTTFSAQGTGRPGAGTVSATNAEGHWYWVTGPESGTLFCLGDQTTSSSTATYTSVGYTNWGKAGANFGEPNNSSNNEHYGYIMGTGNFGYADGQWDDHPVNDATVKSYIVEFGDMATGDLSGLGLHADVTISVPLDTTAPTAPVITAPGAVTNDITPTITGTAEANATVRVTVSHGGTTGVYDVPVDGSGNWSLNPDSLGSATLISGSFPVLVDGDTLVIDAVARDAAGNTSGSTASSTLIDLSAPSIPVITGPGAVVNNSHPLITGTADPGVTVIVTIDPDGDPSTGDQVTYTVVADGAGNWTLDTGATTPTSGTFAGLDDGESMDITAVASDGAGNVSGTSAVATTTLVLHHDLVLEDRRCGLGSNLALGGLLGLFALARLRRSSRRTVLSAMLAVGVAGGLQAEDAAPVPASASAPVEAPAAAPATTETVAPEAPQRRWLVEVGVGRQPKIHGGNERVSSAELASSTWVRTWRVGVAREWEPQAWQMGNQGGIIRVGVAVQHVAGEEVWNDAGAGASIGYRDRLFAVPVTLVAGWQWRPMGHLRLVAAPRVAAGPMIGDITADVLGTGDHASTWAYGLTMSYGAQVEAWWESDDRRNGVGALVGYEVQRASFSYRLRDTAGPDAYRQAYDRRVDMDGWWWSLAYLHAF